MQRFHELMAQPRQKAVQSDSVLAIVDAFLEWTSNHRARRTCDGYRERLQQFIETIPRLTVGRLRPFHVQQWLDGHPSWSDGHKRGCIVAVQRAFRWAEKLDVKFCLYNFRHSFATRLLQSGVDALTVAILLGHADVSMLGRVYQDLSHSPEHLLGQLHAASDPERAAASSANHATANHRFPRAVWLVDIRKGTPQ